MDKINNELGYSLIDFCISQRMLVVNGRMGNDATIGKLTCKNASVVDYMVATPSLFPFINEFEVEDFDECLSDIHSVIKMTMLTNIVECGQRELQSTHNNCKTDMPLFPVWKSTESNSYLNEINVEHINDLHSRIFKCHRKF